ncbi:MAG: alanyl-tRNA editing protein [Bacillota bacterium]
MTERLYHHAPYLRSFTARVVARLDVGGRPAVLLDRTAFYPTSGGQPHDTGRIGQAEVLEVLEEGDRILHVLSCPVKENQLLCEVDFERRYDHMQQHTAQHILSRAFELLANADTVGFHLGRDTTTIDLSVRELPRETILRAEELANDVVFENRPVRAFVVPYEEVSRYNVRKMPEPRQMVRLVEVSGFDVCGCGGTHVRHTGETGIIKVLGTERVRSDVRVHMVSGRRALRDYRQKLDLVERCAAMLSAAPADLPDAISRILRENDDRSRTILHMTEELMELRAREYLQRKKGRLVSDLLQGYTVEQARMLVQRIVQHPDTVALFGVESDRPSLIFARSDDVDLDVLRLLQMALPLIDGRGGGNPRFAQGGGKRQEGLKEALQLTVSAAYAGS